MQMFEDRLEVLGVPEKLCSSQHALPTTANLFSAKRTPRNSILPGAARKPTQFFVEIIKPSHYDDDGYVIQWVRGFGIISGDWTLADSWGGEGRPGIVPQPFPLQPLTA